MIPSTSSCPCLTNFPPAWWLFTSSLALFVAFPPSSSISLLCCFQSAKGTPDRLFAFLPCPSPFRVVPACTREYEVLCDKKNTSLHRRLLLVSRPTGGTAADAQHSGMRLRSRISLRLVKPDFWCPSFVVCLLAPVLLRTFDARLRLYHLSANLSRKSSPAAGYALPQTSFCRRSVEKRISLPPQTASRASFSHFPLSSVFFFLFLEKK